MNVKFNCALGTCTWQVLLKCSTRRRPTSCAAQQRPEQPQRNASLHFPPSVRNTQAKNHASVQLKAFLSFRFVLYIQTLSTAKDGQEIRHCLSFQFQSVGTLNEGVCNERSSVWPESACFFMPHTVRRALGLHTSAPCV